ncbi:hypothetical protein ACFL6L_00755 [candidate division KSB1 bacterium]
MESEDRKSIKDGITALLSAGNLEAAADEINKYQLPKIELTPLIETAYKQLTKDKNLLEAIALCDMYNLPLEWKMKAVYSQFHGLAEEKAYDKAYEWGLQYGMSKNEINIVTVKAFEKALQEKDISQALQYFRDFEIPSDLIVVQARESFNRLFDTGSYISALILGDAFEIARKRVVVAGIKGYCDLLSEKKSMKMIELEKEHKILIDDDITEAEEPDTRKFILAFCDNVVKPLLEGNKPDELFALLNNIDIIASHDKNPFLKEFMLQILKTIVVTHEKLMKDGRGPAAFDIVQNFRLLDSDTSSEVKVDIIKVAEETHNKLMSENNLTAALFLKENYELFNRNSLENSHDLLNGIVAKYLIETIQKGAVENIKTVMKEYPIDDHIKTDAANTGIHQLVRAGQYDALFDIMRNLDIEITDEDTLGEITTKFHNTYEDGHIEIASDLAFYFKLKEPRTQKVFLSHWQRLVDAGKYREARALKKERHLQKKLLEPAIKAKYEALVAENKMEEAINLRKDYKIKQSIAQWFVENVKKLFGL